MAGSGALPHSLLDWSRKHEKGQTHGLSTLGRKHRFHCQGSGNQSVYLGRDRPQLEQPKRAAGTQPRRKCWRQWETQAWERA